jgi:hypothetical protein
MVVLISCKNVGSVKGKHTKLQAARTANKEQRAT